MIRLFVNATVLTQDASLFDADGQRSRHNPYHAPTLTKSPDSPSVNDPGYGSGVLHQ